jgi:hypothetical protein
MVAFCVAVLKAIWIADVAYWTKQDMPLLLCYILKKDVSTPPDK